MKAVLDIPMSLPEWTNALALPTPEKDLRILSISTDSRECANGALFAAIPGNQTHESETTLLAEKAGAVAIVCERQAAISPSLKIPVLRVPSVPEALMIGARVYARKIPHTTVAVTGSVGKTSTRCFTERILSRFLKICATKDNHNNLIGVPMTMFSLTRKEDLLLLELGMNHRGEIASLSRTCEPDIAMITSIGTSHIGLLGNRRDIFRAKTEIIEGMNGGPVCIPADETLFAEWDYRPVTRFSFSSIPGTYSLTSENGLFTVTYPDGSALRGVLPADCLPVRGAAIRALTIADLLGVDRVSAVEAVRTCTLPGGRLEVLSIGKNRLICDAYNSSPESLAAALDYLSALPTAGKRIVVLSDMLELGAHACKAHRAAGKAFARSGADILVCMGQYAKDVREGACEAGTDPNTIFSCDSVEEIALILRKILKSGDTVLIKGSHATGLYALPQFL